jgi:hypothetical protein
VLQSVQIAGAACRQTNRSDFPDAIWTLERLREAGNVGKA